MQRVVVVGTSGAGKTTLAKQLARWRGVPHIELDALHWKPNWTSTPAEEMRPLVSEAVAAPSWTLDGNYGKVRDIIWQRADTLIWLDYSFPVVFSRVLRRTLRRVIRREELWNGNREDWRLMFSRDSILLWVITTHVKRRHEIPEALAQPEFAHLQIVHLRSPRETRNWLQQIGASEDEMGLKDDLKEYYTVQELSALTKITEATIEKLAHGGEIACDIAGAALHIPRAEAEKLLSKHRRAKWRRVGLAGLGVLAAIAGAGVAWQKRQNREEETE